MIRLEDYPTAELCLAEGFGKDKAPTFDINLDNSFILDILDLLLRSQHSLTACWILKTPGLDFSEMADLVETWINMALKVQKLQFIEQLLELNLASPVLVFRCLLASFGQKFSDHTYLRLFGYFHDKGLLKSAMLGENFHSPAFTILSRAILSSRYKLVTEFLSKNINCREDPPEPTAQDLLSFRHKMQHTSMFKTLIIEKQPQLVTWLLDIGIYPLQRDLKNLLEPCLLRFQHMDIVGKALELGLTTPTELIGYIYKDLSAFRSQFSTIIVTPDEKYETRERMKSWMTRQENAVKGLLNYGLLDGDNRDEGDKILIEALRCGNITVAKGMIRLGYGNIEKLDDLGKEMKKEAKKGGLVMVDVKVDQQVWSILGLLLPGGWDAVNDNNSGSPGLRAGGTTSNFLEGNLSLGFNGFALNASTSEFQFSAPVPAVASEGNFSFAFNGFGLNAAPSLFQFSAPVPAAPSTPSTPESRRVSELGKKPRIGVRRR
ncbi:hypothetical protein HDU76_009216 [Blyttiomyces sp. JEL0837]|nr:hypothetical protein HDU76_009216 [Blyttiomyces sp. JEL0837]